MFVILLLGDSDMLVRPGCPLTPLLEPAHLLYWLILVWCYSRNFAHPLYPGWMMLFLSVCSAFPLCSFSNFSAGWSWLLIFFHLWCKLLAYVHLSIGLFKLFLEGQHRKFNFGGPFIVLFYWPHILYILLGALFREIYAIPSIFAILSVGFLLI